MPPDPKKEQPAQRHMRDPTSTEWVESHECVRFLSLSDAPAERVRSGGSMVAARLQEQGRALWAIQRRGAHANQSDLTSCSLACECWMCVLAFCLISALDQGRLTPQSRAGT